jgi:hypothetical protein
VWPAERCVAALASGVDVIVVRASGKLANSSRNSATHRVSDGAGRCVLPASTNGPQPRRRLSCPRWGSPGDADNLLTERVNHRGAVRFVFNQVGRGLRPTRSQPFDLGDGFPWMKPWTWSSRSTPSHRPPPHLPDHRVRRRRVFERPVPRGETESCRRHDGPRCRRPTIAVCRRCVAIVGEIWGSQRVPAALVQGRPGAGACADAKCFPLGC